MKIKDLDFSLVIYNAEKKKYFYRWNQRWQILTSVLPFPISSACFQIYEMERETCK